MRFEYPVTIEKEDVKNALGTDLDEDLAGASAVKLDEFLNTVHRQVYDFFLYATGNKSIKKRIIEKYRAQLEEDIKKLLLAQADYLLSNEENISMWNGALRTPGGMDLKDTQDVVQKVLCPELYNIAAGMVPNIMYGGG